MFPTKLVFWSFILAFNVALLELLSFGAITFFEHRGVILYRPSSEATRENYDRYLEKRDEVLGWTSSSNKERVASLDSSLGRKNSFVALGDDGNCIAVYGDSYVWADGVSDDEAWTAQLTKELGCRVGNYGVPGYGTDQAYLRFKDSLKEKAPTVVLGFMPENVMRNVNQYRELLYRNQHFGFKPRFTLNGEGELEFVPLSKVSSERFEDFLRKPNEELSDEFFVLNEDPGPITPSFPYIATLYRVLTHSQFLNRISSTPRYQPFFAENHPSDALNVTRKLIRRFGETARERNLEPHLLVMPNCRDLQYYENNKTWPYQTLLDGGGSLGVGMIHFGEDLVKLLGDVDKCSICDSCGGHYNARGNRLLAEFLAKQFSSLKNPQGGA